MWEVEYVVGYALFSRNKLITPTSIKNHLQSVVLLLNDDDHALKHNEDEENEWHSLETLGFWFVDYTACDIAVRVCGVDSVNHVFDHQLTRLEEVWDVDKGKNK